MSYNNLREFIERLEREGELVRVAAEVSPVEEIAELTDRMAKQPGGEMSQQELGMHFDLKPGSLSEILSKLEVNGLIERSRNPKDRRQLTIRLTETGRENARIDQAARIRFRERAFSALTHDEREQLAEMLEKIRVTWEELDD